MAVADVARFEVPSIPATVDGNPSQVGTSPHEQSTTGFRLLGPLDPLGPLPCLACGLELSPVPGRSSPTQILPRLSEF